MDVGAGNFLMFVFIESNGLPSASAIEILAKNWRAELQLEWQGQLGEFVTDLAWSPRSGAWAASSAAGEVVWNSGMDDLTILKAADGRSIDRIAISADGRWLAAGGQGGQLLIWDCHRQPQLVTTMEINGWIEHLAWRPTEPQLAIGYGSQVKLWDAIANCEIVKWQFDRSSIFDLSWHPEGKYLAVAGSKGVQFWSPEKIAVPPKLEVETASLKIAWAETGNYLAAANLDRTLAIMDLQQPEDPWILQGCPGKIRHLRWITSNTCPCLAVASGTEIVLWDWNPTAADWNGRLLEGHQSTITALTAHPLAPIVISGDAEGYTCLWSITGEIEQILDPIVSEITLLKCHPDGELLAIGSRNGNIAIWGVSINTDGDVIEV